MKVYTIITGVYTLVNTNCFNYFIKMKLSRLIQSYVFQILFCCVCSEGFFIVDDNGKNFVETNLGEIYYGIYCRWNKKCLCFIIIF